MKLAELSVRRPMVVSMAFLGVVLFGLYAVKSLPIDLFPEIEPPYMSIITLYLGASANDVEDKVTEPIEDSLGLVADLKRITSSSKENLSVVTLEFEFGTDLDEAANDARGLLEMVKRKLPADSEAPRIFKMSTAMMPIYIFSVRVDKGDFRAYRDTVEEQIVEPLQRIAGVGAVQMMNAPERQVLVEVDRRKLAAHHLPLPALAQVLGAANVSVPSGRMDVGSFDLPVRVPGEFSSLKEIRDLVVGQHNGAMVYLRDVATVRMGYQEQQQIARTGGKDAIMVMVQKQSGANIVEVVDRVRSTLAQAKTKLPAELVIQELIDGSTFIRIMVGNLSETILVAGLLVVLVVFLFLRRLRTSLIVGLAIPISLIVVFLGLYLADYSLNVITLMAMALAIGMVVDDGIVVLENITRHSEAGVEPSRAALDGTSEVGLAVTAATLTTVVVFLPLAFVGGLVGIFFGQLAFVITVTIGASLVTALSLTPMLCAKLLKPRRHDDQGRSRRLIERVHQASERAFAALERRYAGVIRWALRHRWPVLGMAAVILAGSLALLPLVGFDFIPMGDSGDIQIVAELRTGTRVEQSAKIAAEVAQALEAQPETVRAFYMCGTSEEAIMSATGGKEGSNIMQVFAKLTGRTERARTDKQVAEAAREVLRRHPEVVAVNFKYGSVFAGMLLGQEKPITVNLQGNDFADLARAAERVEKILAAVPGVEDVSVDLFEERPELRVVVDRQRASRLGVPVAAVGGTLRNAVYGVKVTKFRAGGEEHDIVLRLRKADRDEPADLRHIEIPSMAQSVVPVHNIAQVSTGASPIEIQHRDKQRLVRVGANFSGRPLGDISEEIARAIDKQKDELEGVTVSFGGEMSQMEEANIDLLVLVILGIVLIYMVMVAQFESLLDPFVIMFSIPFAFTGVALTMVVTDTTLTMSAILGMVILLGVVVKNAIVLVDYINLMRRQGLPLLEAVATAGQRRLRPVLMTAMTTALGMLPLAMARAEGAEMWGPMGKAVIGGLMVSLLVTLVLVPTVYVMLERFRRRAVAVTEEATRPELAG
ncbi:MAG: AcrB/AcrD/AcrF family protein [Deltaproteobacteria bacterium]|nr:MAG: AcrB/AcrD/AcrF family protein [Deltaproteobacteria bacterium]